MNLLEYFYIKTIKYEFINKFSYNNTSELPKLKKIILNFGCKTTEIKQLSACLLAIELITNKKGKLTTTKQGNIILKIRKGNPIGCKVILQKSNMFNFLTKMIIEIFPKIKDFKGFTLKRKIQKNSFSYELHDNLIFSELEEQYYLFNNLPNLNITIITSSKIIEELIFILKAFQLPIK